VGLVHAALNTTALTLFADLADLADLAGPRPARQRASGKVLGLAGLGVLLASSYLGGHLSFVKGVDVNRTAWQAGPQEWTAVLPEDELPDGGHRRVEAGGVPVLLYRSAGRVRALADTCSHMGGPLDEGTISDDCVTCPWHGSTFRFDDGAFGGDRPPPRNRATTYGSPAARWRSAPSPEAGITEAARACR
jgi:nitrite reductase/ring-hydroxylating ferredoxin subunit